jgi:uncharacterized caspase-like protein
MLSRSAGILVMLLAALSWGNPPATPWLEIPEADVRVDAEGFVTFPATEVSHFRIHLPASAGLIQYGTIFAKINTESANTVMTTRSTDTGIVCLFDLNLRGGFRLRDGRNSVEIAYKDRFQRNHYASFLLQNGERARTPLLQASKPEATTGEKYAVIVGVSRYQNSGAGLENLRYADRDAAAFRDFLLSPDGGGFKAQNIRFLVNEDATSENVRSALFTFLTKPRPEDAVVLYFAGHGAPDPNDRRNLYLLTHDTRPTDMGGSAFPMWQLQDVFTRILKAKRVITFTDSCHSYGISGERVSAAFKQNNLVNQYVVRYAAEGDRAVITASDISELSYESEEWGGGHGVFTHFLLRGLKGEADANKDGTVTAGELFPFVRDSVQEATGGRQTPIALAGLADTLPLSGGQALKTASAAPRSSAGRIAFAAAPAGE